MFLWMSSKWENTIWWFQKKTIHNQITDTVFTTDSNSSILEFNPRTTAKQILGNPRSLQNPLVSSLHPEGVYVWHTACTLLPSAGFSLLLVHFYLFLLLRMHTHFTAQLLFSLVALCIVKCTVMGCKFSANKTEKERTQTSMFILSSVVSYNQIAGLCLGAPSYYKQNDHLPILLKPALPWGSFMQAQVNHELPVCFAPCLLPGTSVLCRKKLSSYSFHVSVWNCLQWMLILITCVNRNIATDSRSGCKMSGCKWSILMFDFEV